MDLYNLGVSGALTNGVVVWGAGLVTNLNAQRNIGRIASSPFSFPFFRRISPGPLGRSDLWNRMTTIIEGEKPPRFSRLSFLTMADVPYAVSAYAEPIQRVRSTPTYVGGFNVGYMASMPEGQGKELVMANFRRLQTFAVLTDIGSWSHDCSCQKSASRLQ